MNQTTHFLSCDWGTTNLRMQLVDRRGGNIIGGIKQSSGVKATFNAWQAAGNPPRLGFYQQVLKDIIGQLENRLKFSLEKLPIVISGMASSSLGIVELAYSDVPSSLDGSNLVVEKLRPNLNFTHPIILISGIRKANDVMRGEEVQAVGWYASQEEKLSASVLILPGTHSKHLYIEQGKIVDFKTFMTGELFALLQEFSILRNSILSEGQLEPPAMDAFKEGVLISCQEKLSHALFSIRAKSLNGTLSKVEARYFLSGLLIGHELNGIGHSPIFLACPEKLFDLYESAIRLLPINTKVTSLSPQTVENLVIRGQGVILKQLD